MANNHTPLTPIEMAEVAQIFQGSYDYVFSNMLAESSTTVTQWLAGWIVDIKPFMALTPTGVGAATNEVFRILAVRDFILTLQFVFCSRWGAVSSRLDQLCTNLAAGCAVGGESANANNAMPKDIAAEFSTPVVIHGVLRANTWLVVLLLLQLFINVKPLKAERVK